MTTKAQEVAQPCAAGPAGVVLPGGAAKVTRTV